MTYNLRAIDDIQRFALITYRARRGGHAIPEGLIGDGGSFHRKRSLSQREAGAALGTIPQSAPLTAPFTQGSLGRRGV